MAWKAAQSPQVEQIYVAPGNAGTAHEHNVHNVPIAANDIDALVNFAQQEGIALTIIGPEQPLVAGIVDLFKEHNLACFGPTKAAAMLEGSKTFCKEFLQRHHIPTAEYQSFTEVEAAKAYVREQGVPIVIKADGLAAGKGVVIAEEFEQAFSAIDQMLSGNQFGSAGHRVVIEEFLQGEEASFIVMCDGKTVLPMASSQDHKARDDGDQGPNTGGMGAYSPAPVVSKDMHDTIMQQVIEPTIRGLAEDGIDYQGFLYAGLMIGQDGRPKVLEYNCRFGDPETQPIMMRLDSDLVSLCDAATKGQLDQHTIEWQQEVALGVVLAAAGYPGSVKKGSEITGLSSVDDKQVKVFHAGTQTQGDAIQTAGGRVLCVTALGSDVSSAKAKAYEAIKSIQWDGMFYRNDIGDKAIKRT